MRLPIRRSPFGRTPRGGRINEEIEQYGNKWSVDDLKKQAKAPLSPEEYRALQAWHDNHVVTQCPDCGSDAVGRIDKVSDDPPVWTYQCRSCGGTFES